MSLGLTEQQEMMRSSARRFLTDNCPGDMVREMINDTRGYPEELWRRMSELGWLGIIIPEKYGGFGGSYMDLVVLLEEMGRVRLPGPFFSTVVLGNSAILIAGSDRQKEDLLPEIAGGRITVSLAFSEDDGRYGPENIECGAILDGGEFVINGVKSFVSDAHVADYIICAVRTGEGHTPEEGISLLLVDAKSEGISIETLHTIAGDKQCRLSFNGVRVPEQNLIGDKGRGWTYLERILQLAAIGKCAEMIGGGRQVLDMTVAYAGERTQFGQIIGTFQAVQHHCANMLLALESSRLLTYQAAWKLNQGLECSKDVSAAKAWAGDACVRIGALGQQVHGAIAFCGEHDLSLHLKYAKMGQLMFGDSDYHREIVAQALETGDLLAE